MYQTDVAGIALFGYRLPDDDLEIGFAIFPVTYITAIETDHDAAFRDGQRGPLRRTSFDEAALLLAQFGFGAFGDTESVLAQRVGVGTGRDRQDVGEQSGRGGVWHERRPSRLEIEPLRSDMIGNQSAQWRYGRWTAGTLAWATMEPRAGDSHITIKRHEDDGITALAVPADTTHLATTMPFRP